MEATLQHANMCALPSKSAAVNPNAADLVSISLGTKMLQHLLLAGIDDTLATPSIVYACSAHQYCTHQHGISQLAFAAHLAVTQLQYVAHRQVHHSLVSPVRKRPWPTYSHHRCLLLLRLCSFLLSSTHSL
jgi:hypothetical protein